MPIVSVPLQNGEFPISYASETATHYAIRSPEQGWYNAATGAYESAPLDQSKHFAAATPDPDLAGLKWACVPKAAIDPGPFSVLWLKVSGTTVNVLDSDDFGVKGVPWIPPTRIVETTTTTTTQEHELA